jgi:hypothetical protein
MSLYKITYDTSPNVSAIIGNSVCVFNKSNIIARDREKYLLKALSRYNNELQTWNIRKNDTQNLIDDLDPVNNAARIQRLEWRLVLLDKTISRIATIIDNINDQLNNLNYKIVDTSSVPLNTESPYIHNVHNYTNFQPLTFAPNYPIRFYQ